MPQASGDIAPLALNRHAFGTLSSRSFGDIAPLALNRHAFGTLSGRSFTNAKLAENRIENLLHIYDANYFADRSQRLIKINGNVFRRQSLAQGRLRAIA